MTWAVSRQPRERWAMSTSPGNFAMRNFAITVVVSWSQGDDGRTDEQSAE